MKRYKIDAFKGYEKFMKKIGRKEGYICYICWVDKNRMNIKLTYPGFITAHTAKENVPSFLWNPEVNCNIARFDAKGKELDLYKETYDTLVRLHNDLRRTIGAFKEGEK
jgi:hypothetical protein